MATEDDVRRTCLSRADVSPRLVLVRLDRVGDDELVDRLRDSCRIAGPPKNS